VSTDPFVPETLDTEPRQLPNLPPGVHLPPASPWRATRPGDLAGGQPHGVLLGSPGPDVGYARLLVERRRDRMALAPGEHRHDAEAVVAELAMRRAASFGRAPVLADVDIALELLGYSGDAPGWRSRLVDEAAHDYARRRRVVDAVPIEVLRLPHERLGAEFAGVHVALDELADELARPADRA